MAAKAAAYAGPPAVAAHVQPRNALPPRLVALLIADRKPRRYPNGSIITHEGEASELLHLVVKGRVRSFVSDDTDRQLFLGEIGPGEYAGEMLVDGGDRDSTLKAISECWIVSVPRQAFLVVLASEHELEMHVLRKLATRLRTVTELVRRLALTDVHERVMHLLHEMALAQGNLHGPVRISQQAIGNHVGATRSMVNRVVKCLERERIISIGRTGITLMRRVPPAADLARRLPAGV